MLMPRSLALVKSRVVACKALFFAHVGSKCSERLVLFLFWGAKNHVHCGVGSFSLYPPI